MTPWIKLALLRMKSYIKMYIIIHIMFSKVNKLNVQQLFENLARNCKNSVQTNRYLP